MRWFDKDLNKALRLLDEAKSIIETIKETQEEKLDNMPDSLLDSERGEKMQERLEIFEGAFDDLETIIDNLIEVE